MDVLTTTPVIALITFASVLMVILGLGGLVFNNSEGMMTTLRRYYHDKFVLDLQFQNDFERMFFRYTASFGIAAFLAFFQSLFLCIVILIIAVALPPLTYAFMKADRVKKIEEALPSVLQQLAANTQSVSSLSIALNEVSKTAPAPLDYELAMICKQEEELKSLTLALENARARIGSTWFDIVTAVLITASEKGGKASSALENLSGVFSKLAEMQQTISTATSSGRMSLKMLIPLPAIVIVLVGLLQPELVSSVMAHGAGIFMLALSGFFYAISLGLAVYLSQAKI